MMGTFFSKPSTRLDRGELYSKAFNAVNEVVTADTEFNIEFNPDDLDDNRTAVAIDIPDKFYNPDNLKCNFKLNPEELTPEHVAKTLNERHDTSLFLNDEWYSRLAERSREKALQDTLNGNRPFLWDDRDDVFRSN